jgi:hypothetical protein
MVPLPQALLIFAFGKEFAAELLTAVLRDAQFLKIVYGSSNSVSA